ncbi:hypothetical protein ACLKOZ_16885 [Arthrobacter sp. R4]
MTAPNTREDLARIAHDAMFPDGNGDMMTWPPSLFTIADAILAEGYRK